ncbi:hypothetical protein EmuJ_000505800 [Echinococcus multilocularis]|uniref:Uncharacterized protein n=1 Tax=Echinococcus multilocularis TaxID=6211 RepID=A0A068XZV6_ECHMU|nr:hypothetical protein EmuJ_000505800 [Echinococcus multilocularis]
MIPHWNTTLIHRTVVHQPGSLPFIAYSVKTVQPNLLHDPQFILIPKLSFCSLFRDKNIHSIFYFVYFTAHMIM